MNRVLLTAAVAVFVSSCASYTAMAPADRELVERDLESKDADQFTKLSFYVVPFFGDASKKMLSDVPPSEIRLLNDTKGNAIDPGPAEKIIPAGHRVRVLKVEFPTSLVVTERIVYTPRTQPWVYLAIDGEKNDVPYILVLRPQLKTSEEFYTELQRYLVHDDPKPRLDQLNNAVKDAVSKKQAIVDMPVEALEMAWGYPETKKITWQDQNKTELWQWPGGKRTATVLDGRVADVKDNEPPGAK